MKNLIHFIFTIFLTPSLASPVFYHEGMKINTMNQEYTVLEFLGSGNFGFVYKVKKNNGAIAVAKIISNSSPNEVQFNEFKANNLFIKNLNSNMGENRSHFVQVNDVDYLMNHKGKTDFTSLLIEMEYIHGFDLTNNDRNFMWKPHLQNEQMEIVLSHLEKFVDFGIEVIQALSSHQVSHGDINPKNIIFSEDKKIKLIDFDMIHRPGSLKISYDPAYSPQESFKGLSIAGATDLYSLGSSLASFLTGEPIIIRYFNYLKNNNMQDNLLTLSDLQSDKDYHEALIKFLLKHFDKNSKSITDPELRTRYIELANFALQVMNFKIKDRNFFWKGNSFNYKAQTKNIQNSSCNSVFKIP